MGRALRSSRSPDSGRLARALVPFVWLAALAVALLPVVQPLLSRDLTCGYDNTFHLYRAIQVARLWEGGVLYSRWAPDMALGYGFPLYLFTSFFPPALTALIHNLGVAWPVALNATFVLGVAFGAVSMAWLARDLFGGSGEGHSGRGYGAGLVAAVAYAYAPFQTYDVFNRGSLWESLAWAFPPLVLLAVQRYGVRGERRYLAIGVVGLSAMVLSHHLFAFLFGPIFALWILGQAILRRDWRIVGRGALLGALGLGMTTFHWLPPLAERSFVQTERLLGVWVFDYHYNFLPFDHLVALPRRADPALLNDWPQKALGLVPLVVGLLSFVGWRRASSERRLVLGLLWALVAGAAFLTQPASLWIWEHVPLLRYVQYPWRFLGPGAFCLALLAGAAAQTLTEVGERAGLGLAPARIEGSAAALLTAALMLASLGWLYPRHCPAPGDLTVGGMIGWERATDTLGTTAGGEYLPVWVEDLPVVSLDGAYRTGGPIERLRTEDLPDGARIVEADYRVQSAILMVDAAAPFRARYLVFYYPGWHVSIDGERVPVAPEDETGLLTFEVPVGRHVIAIGFGETPLRVGADAGSVAALAVVVLLVMNQRRLETRRATGTGATWSGGAFAFAAVAVVVVAKVLLGDVQGLLWRGSQLADDGSLSGVAVPKRVSFANRALLLGLTPLPARFRADESPQLTLYWQALDPGYVEWRVGLTLVGMDGSRFNAGLRPARWAREPGPLWEWPASSYARMDYEVDVPVGLPPGTYGVELSLFDRATAAPASVLDEEGNPVGPMLALTPVEITRPAEVASLDALGVGVQGALVPCGEVGLWAASLDRDVAAPGDLVALRMVWEALADPVADLQVTVTLLDATSTSRRSWTADLAAPWWPTTAWAYGDRWSGLAGIRLPGGLETGTYTLELSLDSCAMTAWPLAIRAPDRRWEVPAEFMPVGVALGGVVRLAGTSPVPAAISAAETFTLELAWEALTETETSYRVFVHLVDGKGKILAQSDGEPVAWTRPTTGWAAGEVVVDRRSLDVPDGPAGGAELRVGMYDPAGTRLVTASGEDVIVLGVVEVR